MESGCIHEKSGGLFWTAVEMNISKRLKVMHNSGRARTKSQNDWWACVAYKKTDFLIWMSTIIMKEPGCITKNYKRLQNSSFCLAGCWLHWWGGQHCSGTNTCYKFISSSRVCSSWTKEITVLWGTSLLLYLCCVFMIFTMIYMP